MEEVGFPGLLLWVGLSVSTIVLVMRWLRRVKDVELRTYFVALLVAFISLTIQGLSGPTLAVTEGAFLWFVPGVVAYWFAGAGRTAIAGRTRRWREERERAVIGRRSPDAGDGSPRFPMLSRLNLLLGDRRSTVVAIAVLSLVSGFAEAATLALMAVIATSLVGSKHTHVHIGSLHPGVGVLILVALALAVLRLVLQIPSSILPARIAADVQTNLRTKLFHAFTVGVVGGAVPRSRGAAAGHDDDLRRCRQPEARWERRTCLPVA